MHIIGAASPDRVRAEVVDANSRFVVPALLIDKGGTTTRTAKVIKVGYWSASCFQRAMCSA